MKMTIRLEAFLQEREGIFKEKKANTKPYLRVKKRLGRIIEVRTSENSFTTPPDVDGFGQTSCGSPITDLYITDNIVNIYPLSFCYWYYLVDFHVSPTHPLFCDIDGVLFTKDRKKLIAFPQGRIGDRYEIPEGTEIIGENAFERSNITEVVTPSTLIKVEPDSFEYSSTFICDFTKSTKLRSPGSRAFKTCDGMYVIRSKPFALERVYKDNHHRCFFLGPEKLPDIYRWTFEEMLDCPPKRK